ncbi:hypothetical protein F5Y14DRAFT_409114 [Nemania sp. NC0429]|nr:hypothetical protein F5Y14DRAFT_409114 [Nemania sp. NC0429]
MYKLCFSCCIIHVFCIQRSMSVPDTTVCRYRTRMDFGSLGFHHDWRVSDQSPLELHSICAYQESTGYDRVNEQV